MWWTQLSTSSLFASRFQKTVALSAGEAELAARVSAVAEGSGLGIMHRLCAGAVAQRH